MNTNVIQMSDVITGCGKKIRNARNTKLENGVAPKSGGSIRAFGAPRRRDACSPADREAEIRTEPHAAEVLALRDQTTVSLRGIPPPKRKER